jgi:hypothetical protein
MPVPLSESAQPSARPDVPALALHDEIAKFPWISNDESNSLYNSLESGLSSPVVSLADIMRQLQVLTQATGTDGVGHSLALSVTPCHISKMAARAGGKSEIFETNPGLVVISRRVTTGPMW